MTGRVAGKVALVTGGSGGIGEATARLLWEEGARVALVDLDRTQVDQAAVAIDPGAERTTGIAAVLDDEAQAERAVRETVERFGRLDILANVAGVRVWGPVTEADPDSWDRIVRGNLLQVGYTSKFAVREMVKAGGGSIV
ncbi:MAG TPA: SDR family NAD(P)-dependent oxidoreductase, partial [Actinopolymorphaceae bacterium]